MTKHKLDLNRMYFNDMKNILIITADDMSYNSIGCAGCEFKDISPNIDNLAKNGVFFNKCYTAATVCQPSRSIWMTGKYPWNNGALGFQGVFSHVETFVEILKKNGYQTGIIGKVSHLSPSSKFQWDMSQFGYGTPEIGKDKFAFYNFTSEFLNKVNGPFFLMANSHHPHRNFPNKSRFDPKLVKVPGFLADNISVRKELSMYYEGVARCDEIVGSVLKVLKDSGLYEDTLIVFTSDHGMGFPFMKACCYHFSTRVPLIFCFPNKTNTVYNHLVSSVDLMPTLLDILGISCPLVDGTSYKDNIVNNTSYRDYIYSCLIKMRSGIYFQTRSVFDDRLCYVVNMWSGKNEFRNDGSRNDNQVCFKTLSQERRKFLRHRCFEELYDIEKDPFALCNIAGNHQKFRNEMFSIAKKYDDMATMNALKNALF